MGTEESSDSVSGLFSFNSILSMYGSYLQNLAKNFYYRAEIETSDMLSELTVVLWKCYQKYGHLNSVKFKSAFCVAAKNRMIDLKRSKQNKLKTVSIYGPWIAAGAYLPQESMRDLIESCSAETRKTIVRLMTNKRVEQSVVKKAEKEVLELIYA